MNTLRQAAQEYLAMRRSLGFKLQRSGPVLLNFITFLERHRASYITLALALTWAKQPPAAQPQTWAQRLSYVRIFARYRSATDPRTQVPPAGLLPFRPKRARPYLYSNREIRDLLRAAWQLPRHGLRPWTYYCLFGLLSVSGLRVGEAQNLQLQDLDLKAGVLTIRNAKFGKDRLVPLHASTRRVLSRATCCDACAWGQHEPRPSTCSYRDGAIGSMAQISAGLSTACPARSDCEHRPRGMDRACTTCDIDSPRGHCCGGTGPARTLSAACPCSLPISGMSIGVTRTGI
jgi:hypothetical protein